MKKKHILFIHLLNNYTGSPKVLAQEINLLKMNPSFDISLLTSNTEGCLSHIEGIHYFNNGYKWTNRKILLLYFFLYAQIRMFFFIFFHNSYDIIYINTVIPFGAALAAKLKKTKIIYHVHEIYLKPNLIKRNFYKIMNNSADFIICVSQYVKENLLYGKDKAVVIYNPIENHEFNENIDEYLFSKYKNKIIFMTSSLKDYKGIKQFVELSRLNPQYNFKLLCSVSLAEMEEYFSNEDLPSNIELIGKQCNLFSFYKNASITLNLSLPDKWIETFGLTLAESCDAYTPVIAPNYGGPKEIVSNDKNGFLINPYDLSFVSNKISEILHNFDRYKSFAFTAKQSIEKFSNENFYKKILNIILEEL